MIKAFEILGLEDIVPNLYVLDEIANYIFKKSKTTGKKVFDYEIDFKYYYHDFKKRGICLLKDDISWWEFDTGLEAILLEGNSAMGKVLEYRNYKRPSKVDKYNREEVKFYEEKKRFYSLKEERNDLNTLWKYAETKAGEK